jgi:hypothetical protein
VKERWVADRLPCAAKFISQQRKRLKRRTERRERTVQQLNAKRLAAIAAMPEHEREWHLHVAESTERALKPQHSEAHGINYPVSGGVDVKGKLFVPFPLRQKLQGDILFEDRSSGDASQPAPQQQQRRLRRRPAAAAAPP